MAIRIGVICPSNIAFRRFLPALKQCDGFAYTGVAYASPEEWAGGNAMAGTAGGKRAKAERFAQTYGGEVIRGYEALLARPDVDAVYLPLPPALHFPWGRRALEHGKHVLMEKPFTTGLAETEQLLALAREKGLAVHENYTFVYHRQLAQIRRLIASGELGQVRLIRASFGFPFRGADDFRYDRAMGGGALLDCGGYPIRLARLLLGDTARLTDGHLDMSAPFGVDICGSATLRNDAGLTAQVAFGMDNAYQCKLEVWGSRALLTADRVFTAPAELAPRLTVQDNDGTRVVEVEPDDQFRNSIEAFGRCIGDSAFRQARYADIAAQSRAIERLREAGDSDDPIQ